MSDDPPIRLLCPYCAGYRPAVPDPPDYDRQDLGWQAVDAQADNVFIGPVCDYHRTHGAQDGDS